jgi:hypothetical protein
MKMQTALQTENITVWTTDYNEMQHVYEIALEM